MVSNQAIASNHVLEFTTLPSPWTLECSVEIRYLRPYDDFGKHTDLRCSCGLGSVSVARVIIEGLTNPIKLPSSDLRGERASGILKIYDTKGSKCMATRFPASVAPQLATQMAFTPDNCLQSFTMVGSPETSPYGWESHRLLPNCTCWVYSSQYACVGVHAGLVRSVCIRIEHLVKKTPYHQESKAPFSL